MSRRPPSTNRQAFLHIRSGFPVQRGTGSHLCPSRCPEGEHHVLPAEIHDRCADCRRGKDGALSRPRLHYTALVTAAIYGDQGHDHRWPRPPRAAMSRVGPGASIPSIAAAAKCAMSWLARSGKNGDEMQKRLFARLAISAVIVIGGAGALTAAGTGVALASGSYTCVGNPVGYCIAHVYSGAVLHKTNGGTIALSPNESVKIQCWYRGSTADGYWDHVIWTAVNGNVIGHVDDDSVNFGGRTPRAVGLAECGIPITVLGGRCRQAATKGSLDRSRSRFARTGVLE